MQAMTLFELLAHESLERLLSGTAVNAVRMVLLRLRSEGGNLGVRGAFGDTGGVGEGSHAPTMLEISSAA